MFETINNDLKEALKSGDKFKLSVLRMLKSALQLEAINSKREIDDALVIEVLKKQVKQRNDSKKEYEALSKTEIANDLTKEVEILKFYLPKEATDEEIDKAIEDAFKELNPTSMKDMGGIMKYVSSKFLNVDMVKVSSKVKERLTK